jgi:16S rRNA (uracil1498-N3)-methyltransferase
MAWQLSIHMKEAKEQEIRFRSFATDRGGRIVPTMAERFYVNCPLAHGKVLIQGTEAHHLAHVCRVRAGDAILLFNGDGNEYSAQVTLLQRNGLEVLVGEHHSPVRELNLVLIVAAPLPKGDRAQFLVEKLTELGVTRYVPLRTSRSVVYPRETKQARLERYVVEASKQCGRNVLMQIEPLTTWQDFVHRADLPADRRIAHVGAEMKSLDADQDLVCAAGPEGGFADEEVELARKAGWQVLGLGPRILRVETAALVLATLAVTSCSRR